MSCLRVVLVPDFPEDGSSYAESTAILTIYESVAASQSHRYIGGPVEDNVQYIKTVPKSLRSWHVRNDRFGSCRPNISVPHEQRFLSELFRRFISIDRLSSN